MEYVTLMIQKAEKKEYHFPKQGSCRLSRRPVIIGTGPAGLFCGLALARAGYCPVILERGDCVEERQKKVEFFWKTGILDETSNVQFGEGGAGTFSDGKLNTAVKDSTGRNRYVLESFVGAGAPEEILWLNKPHIGTDILRIIPAFHIFRHTADYSECFHTFPDTVIRKITH